MFASLLPPDDARRATEVVTALLGHGFRGALAGGLAIEAQLRRHGRPVERRALNDIDFVVDSFASIPGSLAASFLQSHVHPDATDGRMLLQLVDEPRAMRIDLFQALGGTSSRAVVLDEESGPLHVVPLEDLVARTTALVCGRLRRGQNVDVKHVTAFRRLVGLGRPELLAAAWDDQRQQISGTIETASREAARSLEANPELAVAEHYSSESSPCERCREHGPFRPAPSSRIVEILGYL